MCTTQFDDFNVDATQEGAKMFKKHIHKTCVFPTNTSPSAMCTLHVMKQQVLKNKTLKSNVLLKDILTF